MTELSPRAKALLDAAAGGDEPTTADQKRVRTAVFAAVGLPIPVAETAGEVGKVGLGSGAQAAVAAKASVWLGWKVLAVALVVGGVGTGVYLSQGDEQTVAGVERQAAPAAADVQPTAPPPQPEVEPTPAVAPEPEDGGKVEPGREAVDPAGARKAAEPKAAAPSSVERKAEAPKSTDEPVRAKSSEPKAPVADPEPRAADPTRSLRGEHALLSRARSALRRGDSAQALQALARHRDQYAGGALVQERRVLEVLARCARGELGKARALARRFSADHPNSPLGRRLESSCVGSGR